MKHIRYNHWIETNYPTKDSCINKCSEAAARMVDYFDDLTIQVGTANGICHCWCRSKHGDIIDPTAKQLDDEIEYKRHPEFE